MEYKRKAYIGIATGYIMSKEDIISGTWDPILYPDFEDSLSNVTRKK